MRAFIGMQNILVFSVIKLKIYSFIFNTFSVVCDYFITSFCRCLFSNTIGELFTSINYKVVQM